MGKGEGRRGEEGGGSTVLRCMSLHDHDYSDNFACCIELVVCGVYNLSELTIAPAMLTFPQPIMRSYARMSNYPSNS